MYSDEEFYLILHRSGALTPKWKYYVDRLSSVVRKVHIIRTRISTGTWSDRFGAYLEILSLVSLGYSMPRADRVFISSVEIQAIQYVLHRQSTAQIITFDDGTLHISPNVFAKRLAHPEGGGALDRMLRARLGIRDAREYIGLSAKHYTIYDAIPNVMSNAEYIPLFAHRELQQGQSPCTATRRIFIGQPIYELEDRSAELCASITQRVIEAYDIDGYVPHPREDYYVDGVSYIDTNMIFEDYILEEMRLHPDTRYEVYSFCSSCLLNLWGIRDMVEERLRFVSIKPNPCPDFLLDTYEVYERIGIRIIAFDFDPSL